MFTQQTKTRSNTINRLWVIRRYSGGCICVVEKVVQSDRLISSISVLVVKVLPLLCVLVNQDYTSIK
ncbi:hypothetical protein O181_071900 [Austropuccinia psidii MF-1]|uniref:Uncharacterized protein n=1 Tax=Austropuccinia psidii MF-1 TaxID=1389203 RepID=A0A9Q3EZE8_9BASI|nr:hypothetical protein [Austropuccinia psidii MF-1]